MGILLECCVFLYDANAKYSTNQKSHHKFRLKFCDARLRHKTLVRTLHFSGCVISQINRCLSPENLKLIHEVPMHDIVVVCDVLGLLAQFFSETFYWNQLPAEALGTFPCKPKIF